MPVEIVQAQYEELATIGQRFARQAEASAALRQQVERCADALRQNGWQGRGASAFGEEMDNVVTPVMERLHAALTQSHTVTMQIIEIVQQAEEEAADPFKARTQFDIPLGVAAAAAAGFAAGGLDGDGTDGGGSSDGSRRESIYDRRVDERIALDERWRRPPGGDRGGSHLDYDWAGGAILERYLTGGDDWIINNDPRWTEYMQQNAYLTADLQDRALSDAQEMAASGETTHTIDQSYSMAIENGEGIVGYQYLHGANADVGGFQRQGTVTVAPDGSGGSIVTMNMHYTWNDVIDPNPQYATDTWKSRIAEIITLGQADPYIIRIGWDETTIVHLDADGQPIEIRNE